MNNKLHIVSNAHLDPIWLWRWQEGCGEVLQTFRSAVDRLKEYKGLVFTCSSASYYKWVEEIDPELFEEIRKLVRKGRWVPVNGWWVQPDCNMPSAESFARQALYSQLYYYEKFGEICKTGYNVDSFGHNAMMPQLLNKGGMRCYVMMRPSAQENAEIPENLFWWDSPDGSRVLTYRIPCSYGVNGKNDIDRELPMLRERAENTGHGMMLFFGVGNHGGGPTKGDLDYLLELKENGYEELEYSSPDEYFAEMCADKELNLPTWSDELQHHASGCYSATSMVKQLNRKAEYWLANAEKWNTVCGKITNLPKATEEFGKAWQEVCFNQFHDILCGCSIMEAYDDVRDSMGYAMKIAANEENKAMLKIAGMVNTWLDGVTDTVATNARHHCRNLRFPRPVIVFNPNSFEVETNVRTYHPSRKVENAEGKDIIFQNVRSSRSNDSHKDTVFRAKVPAMGYATYWLWHEDSEYCADLSMNKSDVSADGLTVENKYLKVVFDDKTGGISSLVSKEDGTEYVGGEFCIPTIIDNSEPDTWAHNIFKFDKEIAKMELKSIDLAECGAARAVMRVKHIYNGSYLNQDYILDSESKHIRVKCRILWQEPLTILKMPVTVDGENPISTYEIPAGYIKRPCNGEEEPALTWGDITACNENRKGVALISDAKYSYDCPNNTLRLTMLRNCIFADHYSDRPAADFSYTDEGIHRFEYAIYPHNGEAESSGVQRIASLINSKPVAIPVGYHKGELPQNKSFVKVNKENVRLDAFKFCEDGSGDVVMRFCETDGRYVKAAIVCDIAEAGFYADFNPFEIKTFRINAEGYVAETDFLEGIVND